MIKRHPTLVLALGAILLAALAGLFVWNLEMGLRLRGSGGSGQEMLAHSGDYGRVPDFSLTERSHKIIRLEDLLGRVWVANFIFTSCKETCPAQSAALAQLHTNKDLGGKITLVSITVDPERDTPDVLSNYANRFGAHPDSWYFLTGDRDEIYRLAQKGFRLGVAPATGSTGDTNFIHSSRLVLVDREARIRGYYQSTDPQALHKLAEDIKLILVRNKTYG